jgi:hypothetical protein
MDALSDVLRAVRLTGAIFFDVHASDPWVAETPPGRSIVGRMFPGAEHLVSYHVMTHGSCWATVHGGTPIRLTAGDIVVFPQGDGHAMSSTPGMRKAPDVAMYRPPTDGQLPFTISVGDSTEESARFVCGFLGCDARPFNPLLAALPPVIRVSDGAGGAIDAFVQFAVTESKEPRLGGECVLGRLSELMFVDVVRRYLETLPADRTGWLAGLREPFVGHPPMQYLANWRMQLAANFLQSGTGNVTQIAERVGYESEAAFSRAFKKAVGVPPSQWRKRGA